MIVDEISLLEHHAAAFDAECAAHRLVLDVLKRLPMPARRSPEAARIRDLLVHCIDARDLWLARIRRVDSRPGLFPVGLGAGRIAARLTAMRARWLRYHARLRPQSLSKSIRYVDTAGGAFDVTVEDVLTHLPLHAFHHRGQAVLLLRELGIAPPVTDYIDWIRRPIAGCLFSIPTRPV